jgi:hypothetical protein
MFKRLAIICLLVTVFTSVITETASAKTKKTKKKSSRQYRPSKHARKSRRFSKHHGTGPDLKTITTESPYTEDPSNGVTPIEINNHDFKR